MYFLFAKNENKKATNVVLAAAMGIGGITVGAHEVLKSAGEIKNNEEVVLENQNGLALYEKENSGAIQMEVETDIILPENLYKDGIPIAKYIMELKTERNGSVPECYLDNGTMIVLTDFDGDTWDMKTGDVITEKNVRSVRPGFGVHPKFLPKILGKKVNRDLEKGTPFELEFVTNNRCKNNY